jgi:hypothetical protein
MKKYTILIILSIAIIAMSCKSKKYISFTYSVMTRGFNMEATVTKDSTIIKKSNQKEVSKFKTDKKVWENLIEQSETVDLNTLPNLESPTNKRQFDGAMFAYLTIVTKDSIYKSASFDAGFPPNTIQPIVDILVEVSNIENGE